MSTSPDAATTVQPPPLPVEWTQISKDESCGRPYRIPTDAMEYSQDETEVCIVGTAGQKITFMGRDLLKTCPKVERLILRSHLLMKMEGLDMEDNNLELLELYDNQIEALENLDDVGPNLRVLDMSYNMIRDMAPVSLCGNLVELYLANNKVKTMAGLSSLARLKKVDLGANRIRVMEETELSGLPDLEELWLGKNKIERIDGISKLSKLRRLDVQANRLTSVDNLEAQNLTLEELYLSHNAITAEGLGGLSLEFPKLSTLDISRNRLTNTIPLAHLTSVEDLWLSGNEIKDYQSIETLGNLENLDCVYLEYNPIDDDFEYRKKIKQIMPSLNQIDAVPIRPSGFGHPSLFANNSVRGVLKPGLSSSIEQLRDLQGQAIDLARAQQTEKVEAD